MPNATAQSILGFAKESVRGTIVAPSVFIPVRNPQHTPDITMLEDKGLRGSNVDVYNHVQGRRVDSYDWAGDVFTDTTPYLVMLMLGAVATASASPLNTHTFALLNGPAPASQPMSATLTDFNGFEATSLAAAMLSDLSFKFSADGLAEYTAKAMAMPASAVSTPTPSFSTITPTPVWTSVLLVGGSAVPRYEDCEINFKRTVTAIPGTSGSQSPYKIFSGPLTVDGKVTLVYEDDTDFNHYLTNDQPAFDLKFTMPGTGAAAQTLEFSGSKVTWRTGKVVRGKTYSEVECDLSFEPTTANGTSAGGNGYSPIKVIGQNVVAGY